MPRRPRSARAEAMPSATRISAPASRRAAASASGPTTASTGDTSRVRSSCESSGRRAWRSKTTRSGCRAPSTSRAVSRGSSASTVPIPTAIASDSARQRWTRARLSGPEIQGESPGAVVVRPSREIASFRVTSGRPVRACLRKGWLRRRAARRLLAGGEGDLDAAVAEDPGAAAGGLLGGVVGGDHDPRDPGLEQRVDARGLAPLVCAGLERHVHRRPGGVVAPLGRSRRAPPAPRAARRARRGSPRRGPRRRRRRRRRPADWG